MFRGIERGTNKCFLILVEHRNADTLLPIIQDWILPGTTIMSDLWGAYGGIGNLPQVWPNLKGPVRNKMKAYIGLRTLDSESLPQLCGSSNRFVIK